VTDSPGRLRVHPGPPLASSFEPPGDKSITHRAFILGLIAAGDTEVTGANDGLDCAATLRCAEALGARVRREEGSVRIAGRGASLSPPGGVLDCGNSGTTLRLLAGVVAAQPFRSVLDGDDSLRARPVRRIVEPLRRMGARLEARDGDRFPPLVVEGGKLHAVSHDVPVASAQVASCLLLAGLRADGVTTVALPAEARDHTQLMLPAFGIELSIEKRTDAGPRVSVEGPQTPRGARVEVPGDFSAAAFFLAAAAAIPGARVRALSVGLNPTRTALLDVLENMGAIVRREPRDRAGEAVGDVTVEGPARLRGFDVPEEWVPRMVDEVPAWAIAAAAAEGVSTVRGAAELRVKESDRLGALAEGLARLGIEVDERPDGLAITGGVVRGGRVSARSDHRMAMAFALMGLGARAPVTVADAAGIDTSFPGFAATLRRLGGRCDGGEEAT
jgi:3-phosphoshikimate 1-carboxyvinyltransferase